MHFTGAGFLLRKFMLLALLYLARLVFFTLLAECGCTPPGAALNPLVLGLSTGIVLLLPGEPLNFGLELAALASFFGFLTFGLLIFSGRPNLFSLKFPATVMLP